jgi:hypothetical protein
MLALNCDLPNLLLLSSYNYKCEPLAPVSEICYARSNNTYKSWQYSYFKREQIASQLLSLQDHIYDLVNKEPKDLAL